GTEAKYPAHMSGGQQQRVAIARAMAAGPKIIFADEPTGNLDAASASAVLDLLVPMVKERQKSLLLVTHDASVAAKVGNPLRLLDGRLAN
ncbi:MAG TPA: ABC transporter, partial [Verrucomicrobiales bacterium]|nr:ABC transporter [Verrucomicrobiales bacterium]